MKAAKVAVNKIFKYRSVSLGKDIEVKVWINGNQSRKINQKN